jgi:16S rRNA (adenine1518-N6/adenine1519-N6)-dimethyltransferase
VEEKRKNVFAKKSLGQNFLVDKGAIAKIVAAVPEKTPLLLEIGPGRGALSTELFRRCDTFCVLEKDDLFAENIGGTLFIHGSRKHHVFHADALEFDWDRIWAESGLPPETPLVVSANLPYNVATEILFRLLALKARIPRMVLMFQKEVGVRIAARAGTKECGVISVAVQNSYSVRVQQILKPGAFRPSPKVDSVVLEFERLATPQVDLSAEDAPLFTVLVKAAFAHRRKTLENSLSMESGRFKWLESPSREAIKGYLAAAGIEGARRAETLTVEEFGKLFREMRK